MRKSLEIIKLIIREEIGRNFKSNERIDVFPYIGDDYIVSIQPYKDEYYATIKIGDKSKSKKSKTEEELKMWIRNILRRFNAKNDKNFEFDLQKSIARIK